MIDTRYRSAKIDKRYRSAKTILLSIIERKGKCGSIQCNYCPLKNNCHASYENVTIHNSHDRYRLAVVKAVELKIIKEEDVFDKLL